MSRHEPWTVHVGRHPGLHWSFLASVCRKVRERGHHVYLWSSERQRHPSYWPRKLVSRMGSGSDRCHLSPRVPVPVPFSSVFSLFFFFFCISGSLLLSGIILKCPDESCMGCYVFVYGLWLTGKEPDRAHSDQHTAPPQVHQCIRRTLKSLVLLVHQVHASTCTHRIGHSH